MSCSTLGCSVYTVDVRFCCTCMKTGKQSSQSQFSKKGTATNIENYTPISLTCVASNIMERIISNQMASFFLENSVINKAQRGFLKGLSTSTHLLECFNHWTISYKYENLSLQPISILLRLSIPFHILSYCIVSNSMVLTAGRKFFVWSQSCYLCRTLFVRNT